jgi:hypothetical protein
MIHAISYHKRLKKGNSLGVTVLNDDAQPRLPIRETTLAGLDCWRLNRAFYNCAEKCSMVAVIIKIAVRTAIARPRRSRLVGCPLQVLAHNVGKWDSRLLVPTVPILISAGRRKWK